MAENFSNDFQTTLSAAIADDVVTSISVVSGTGAPAANFRIRVGNEYMLVTDIGAGTNWTVTRGVEGSTAAAHVNGTVVAHVVTTGGFQQYVADQLTGGTVAARVASLVVAGALTVSGLTVGSILFAGVDGLISQDNVNLFWNDTDNYLGVNRALAGGGTVSAPAYSFAAAPARGMMLKTTISLTAPFTVPTFVGSGNNDIQFFCWNDSSIAAHVTAGFALGTYGGWEIHFRTTRSEGWFEIADANGGVQHRWNAKDYLLASTGTLGWSSESNFSSAQTTARDVALGRNAAGVVEVNSGTAGQFRDLKSRRLVTTEYIEGTEMAAPSAPVANGYRLFAQDNGAGKTQLMALFASGVAQQLAIEP